jgi:MFS family permease
MQDVKRGVLLTASFLTLIAAGMGFAVRGAILGNWATQYGFTNTELGTITGGGLVGFGVVILLASLITDRVGYKSIMLLAGVLQIGSYFLTIAAGPAFISGGKDSAFQCLYWGMFMFSVSCGLCEAVINPLVATLYPTKKIHYLNILHAGWPAGLVLGAVVGIVMGAQAWQVQLGMFLIPVVAYFGMSAVNRFPQSEASAAGVSFGTMLMEFLNPVLLLLLFLHACVGYVELGTDSWISKITGTIAVGQGLYLFIYASLVMTALRFFAGPIVEKINPLGLLCVSAALGATGLFFIGSIPVESAGLVWVAVTIYSLGKTFLWPTMLGVVGERFPKGGALTMGAMGGIGMLSAGLLGGPGIGYKQDYFASHNLQDNAKATYERYAAETENGFPLLSFFPKVKGLDGAKVGVLDNAEGRDAGIKAATESKDAAKIKEATEKKLEIERDYSIFAKEVEEKKRTEVPKDVAKLHTWWQTTGKAHQADDAKPVSAATLYGGQMAMKYTALVPSTMFIGYLILVLYFKARGGYKQVHIGHGDETTKTEM